MRLRGDGCRHVEVAQGARHGQANEVARRVAADVAGDLRLGRRRRLMHHAAPLENAQALVGVGRLVVHREARRVAPLRRVALASHTPDRPARRVRGGENDVQVGFLVVQHSARVARVCHVQALARGVKQDDHGSGAHVHVVLVDTELIFHADVPLDKHAHPKGESDFVKLGKHLGDQRGEGCAGKFGGLLPTMAVVHAKVDNVVFQLLHH
mmetsp:Transcript_39087/g.98508  ORF Transcript_39087/g.98508 Transcript_39087/m.98508 type:complete len:210 (-) Transcript_39087:2135-2764(-)